ncbi:hypothetical protein [Kribbella italica]|uniref:NADH:ubiquinone oxidoreductase subunit B-like Fe-S oxidoreductase n=1 Tax=Kribbella italica TaxID=1540520 RepID=A0A7W9MW95_9ACTN|nr:hypothetical protein [Kribbella italica]MBB5838649.1 NADH:ubiquinone oxidoreductase subunit B-like Fe-S oxidoreductase [Kribbella italica]
MNLRVRVVHCGCAGGRHWYADIDDAEDPQPDDPFWYVDGCASQAQALETACRQLSSLARKVYRGDRLVRVLD